MKGKGLISIPSANHDVKRPRADGRTVSDLKVIFTFLLTWPGVPFIYYGDEIGMRYIPGLASKRRGIRSNRIAHSHAMGGRAERRLFHR